MEADKNPYRTASGELRRRPRGRIVVRLAAIVCVAILLSGTMGAWITDRRIGKLMVEERNKQVAAAATFLAISLKNHLASEEYDAARYIVSDYLKSHPVEKRIILHLRGFARRVRSVYYVIVNPVIEELVFRIGVLGVALVLFEPLTAIVVMTAAYVVYSSFIYGSPYAADGLVTGVLFSLAFLEFGFIIVLVAHVFYRFITMAWMR